MAVMLDREGLLLAIIMGLLIYVFGSQNYLFLMLVFFVLAVLVTKYEHDAKRELGLYEHERGWENVLSNGILPTLIIVFHPVAGLGAYIGALAAITADKFASELGVLSRHAFFLQNFKPIKPGKSGAVSTLGLFMSLAGALLLGIGASFLFPITPFQVLIIGFMGFFGSMVDSLFGILEERGLGTKGTTNFFCSLTGAALGYFLIPA